MGEQLISGEIPSRLRGMERGSKQIPDTSFGWMRLLTRHSGGHRNRAGGVDRRQLGAYSGRDVRVPDFGPPRGCGSNRLVRGVARGDLRQVQNLLDGAALLFDLLLQEHDGVDQLFRPRRAARHEHVHGNYLVDRDQRIIVEHACRSRARAH